MLGFLPGFAYMAPVDETIAAPRRPTPRLRVPAGSVGIAGLQTGVYPRDSPGGWQIIGRTALNLFDPGNIPPALLAPGDRVRFVPTAGDAVSGTGRTEIRPKTETAPMGVTRYATVLRPGLLTTIQDAGRWGYQDLGVPVSGPMDHVAQWLANALLGNPRDAATLEATWLGPELRMEQETWVAVAGGESARDARRPPTCRCTRQCAAVPGACCASAIGALARVPTSRSMAGIAVPSVLGSRATHVLSGLGGIGGRALKTGDRIPLADTRADPAPRRLEPPVVRSGARAESLMAVAAADLRVRPAGGARLRVLPGPQAEYFAPSALEALQGTRYTISPQSDRMGYRLAGGAPVPCAIRGDMISEAAFVGGVQLPASGAPILLMADRQTSGGYPQLAVVITADLPVAGQLGPGDWIEFEVCDRADAIAALIELEGKLLAVG